MKHEKLSRALDEISQAHISEAAQPKRRVKPLWLGAVAAVLAVAVLAATVFRPMTASAQGLIAAPTYPEMVKYTEENWKEYRQSQDAQYDQPEGYANSATGFFRDSLAILLSGAGEENAACSPVNLYMALAMLAEATGGESRQEILDALGSDSIGELRTQAGHVWNAHYHSDGMAEVVLANSLWLDEAFEYHQSAVDTIAKDYYASVYRGDLGSDEMNKALRDWLNEQTHGLLREQAEGITQSPECILALASTLYYNVQWKNDFHEQWNEEGIFHAPGGDVDATYLRKDHIRDYYRGENYGAVYESLRDGSKLWLILPDEGATPQQLLEEGHALDTVLSTGKAINISSPIVHLWLPKFDIAADRDILGDLETLGISQVQDMTRADFSPLLVDDWMNPYLSQASHATRVAVDEKGVTAAAYTVLMVDAGAADIEEPTEIDFILDRPFLFVVTSNDNLPLFAGIVNTP